MEKVARRPRKCSIPYCGGHQGEVSVYKTPGIIKNQGEKELTTSTTRRERWIEAINLKNFDEKKTGVSSRHFVSGELSALLNCMQVANNVPLL